MSTLYLAGYERAATPAVGSPEPEPSGQGLQTAIIFLSDGRQISEIYPLTIPVNFKSQSSKTSTPAPPVSTQKSTSASPSSTRLSRLDLPTLTALESSQSSPQETNTVQSPQTGLPSSTKIAIAVVVPCIILGCLTLVFLYIRLRRRFNVLGGHSHNNAPKDITSSRCSYCSCADRNGAETFAESNDTRSIRELDGSHWRRELEGSNTRGTWTSTREQGSQTEEKEHTFAGEVRKKV